MIIKKIDVIVAYTTEIIGDKGAGVRYEYSIQPVPEIDVVLDEADKSFSEILKLWILDLNKKNVAPKPTCEITEVVEQ